jgi:hypothetical protein
LSINTLRLGRSDLIVSIWTFDATFREICYVPSTREQLVELVERQLVELIGQRQLVELIAVARSGNAKICSL